MPRNYKTGPARSRRRPDPSTIQGPSAIVYPLLQNSAATGVGTLSLQLIPINAENGGPQANDLFQLTGAPWNVYATDGGVKVAPDAITWDSGTSILELSWTAAPVSIACRVVIENGQQALRGKNGEWIGTFGGEYDTSV